ncbi:hypothetical protein WCT72_00080 [Dickeya dianthicola]
MTKCSEAFKPALCNLYLLVVILVVLTEREFKFSLLISQLLAKAIPVRGAKFIKGLRMQPFAFQNTFRKPFQNTIFAILHKNQA